MSAMRLADLQHRRADGGIVQPLGNMVTQRANTFGDGAGVFALTPFARNDKHKPQPLGMGIQNERNQGRVRLRDCHTVQVKTRFRHKLSLLEP